MAAYPTPTKAAEQQPLYQIEPQNLTVDSTWREILNELNTIQVELTKLKEAPVCLDQYGS